MARQSLPIVPECCGSNIASQVGLERDERALLQRVEVLAPVRHQAVAQLEHDRVFHQVGVAIGAARLGEAPLHHPFVAGHDHLLEGDNDVGVIAVESAAGFVNSCLAHKPTGGGDHHRIVGKMRHHCCGILAHHGIGHCGNLRLDRSLIHGIIP
jgi:hypothetical protein